MPIYIYKTLKNNLDVEYKVQSFQPSTKWQECLVMTKRLDNVGWLPSLSQSLITCSIQSEAGSLKQARFPRQTQGQDAVREGDLWERVKFVASLSEKSKYAIYP